MKIKLKDVRIAFAQGIFTSKKSENGAEQFSATFLFAPEHEAHAQLKSIIDEAGTAAFAKEWPGIKKAKLAKDKLIIHEGDIQTKHDGFAGMMYVIAYNKIRPEVRDRDASVLVASDNKLYSGCFVDVHLDISAYNSVKYGPQISCNLLGVQLRRQGDAFTGGAPKLTDTDFEVIKDGTDADDLL